MGSIIIGKLLRHRLVSKSFVCVKFEHLSAILKIWQGVAVVVPASPCFITAAEQRTCLDLYRELALNGGRQFLQNLRHDHPISVANSLAGVFTLIAEAEIYQVVLLRL